MTVHDDEFVLWQFLEALLQLGQGNELRAFDFADCAFVRVTDVHEHEVLFAIEHRFDLFNRNVVRGRG